MRILVVDPDDSFASEVVRHLNTAGMEAVHAASPAQMDAHLRMRTYQAVLVDLSLRRMNGFDVARGLRAGHPASALEIVLLSPSHREDAPEIQTLKRDTKCRSFLSKPVNLDALVAALRRPLPVADTATPPANARPSPQAALVPPTTPSMGKKFDEPAPKPRKGGRRFTIHWANAQTIAELWLSRKTGVLSLAGKRTASAGMVDGGMVDDDGRRVVRAALSEGSLTFSPGHVDGVGDWGRMGKVLFKAARTAGDARTLRRYLNATPTPNEVTPLARVLPLSDYARQFVSRVNGQVTVEAILERDDIPAGDVSKDVIALARLGLLELVRDGRPVDFEAQSVTRPAAQADVDSTAPSVSRYPVEEAPLLQRLNRELATVETAPPPVVLGVPAESPRSMVEDAARRMKLRYEEILCNEGSSDEVKRVAATILERVEQAHRTFNFDSQMVTGGNKKPAILVDDEVEKLLGKGREHIASKQWAQADNVLTQAHAKQIDHVAVLANLGWARLHNPDKELETRTEEGKDFLLLAEQFDPRDADGQYYLAQVLVASGMLEAAELRASRSVEHAPADPLRSALLKKVRMMRARDAEKAR